MRNKNFNKKLVILPIISFVAIFVLLAPSAMAATPYAFYTDPTFHTINGALFGTYVTVDPTGSGVFDAFLRISGGQENKPPPKCCVKGYNTDGELEFDEVTSSTFTYAFHLAWVPIVYLDNYQGHTGWYREFQLDINEDEGGDSEYLSLDELEIYLTYDQYLTGYPFDDSDPTGDPTGKATKVWELDDGADNYLILNYSMNAGGGKRDIIMWIPNEDFENNPYYDNCGYIGSFYIEVDSEDYQLEKEEDQIE